MTEFTKEEYKNKWESICNFDFDLPESEYNFSLRLQNKYYWTINFTKKVILEYKKFMFLATISKEMVSPSESIDLVWHQHLTFSKSYQEFCLILGKNIDHIPSNHSNEDFEKLKLAKIHTTKIYNEYFGEQPEEIWNYYEMKDILKLKKAKYKIRSILVISLLAIFFLAYPMFFILKPILIQIQNPYFLLFYLAGIILSFLTLSIVNKSKINSIFNNLNRNSFIFELEPDELIYLQNPQKSNIIYGHINYLIENNSLKINEKNQFEIDNLKTVKKNNIDFTILNFVENYKSTPFNLIYKNIYFKPAIDIISKSINSMQKHFLKSREFYKLFLVNIITFLIIFIFGFERIIIGISRGKEVTLLVLTIFFFLIAIIFFLIHLKSTFLRNSIIKYYKKEKLNIDNIDDFYWNYFLKGSIIFNASFIPLMRMHNNSGADFSSNSSSCGSSCGGGCSGGSCGGGCGGCGN